jgi:hypothetical protein
VVAEQIHALGSNLVSIVPGVIEPYGLFSTRLVR